MLRLKALGWGVRRIEEWVAERFRRHAGNADVVRNGFGRREHRRLACDVFRDRSRGHSNCNKPIGLDECSFARGDADQTRSFPL